MKTTILVIEPNHFYSREYDIPALSKNEAKSIGFFLIRCEIPFGVTCLDGFVLLLVNLETPSRIIPAYTCLSNQLSFESLEDQSNEESSLIESSFLNIYSRLVLTVPIGAGLHRWESSGKSGSSSKQGTVTICHSDISMEGSPFKYDCSLGVFLSHLWQQFVLSQSQPSSC